MMRAAAEVVSNSGLPVRQRPAILGVTILTSMDSGALREAGISGPAAGRVLKLAKLAKASGLDGVVASPHEVPAIRRACGKDFLIVVPGIRPEFASGKNKGTGKADDQTRVATPAAAIRAGADYLVVGRPITAAPDPEAAARAIVEEIASALLRS